MRSAHGDEFNHDDQADSYDENVQHEENPIRAGYASTLSWTCRAVRAEPGDVIVDLGAGTGNTSLGLDSDVELVCVDLSEGMLDIARKKLDEREHVDYVVADVLEWMTDDDNPGFDGLVSTYALHHLTEDEKSALFEGLWQHLRPGGRAVFGDLMFRNRDAEDAVVRSLVRAGHDWMPEEVEEEFFWYVEPTVERLQEIGFDVLEPRRFSALSWGIAVERPDES